MLRDAHGARRPPGRARLLAPAPPPEDRRGVAVAGRRRRAARARWARRRCAVAAAAGYVGAGTVEFLLDAGRRLVLPGAERPPAGRAPGHRGGDAASTWCARSSRSPPASRWSSSRPTCACAATRSSAASTPRTRPPASCPPTGRAAAASGCRAGPGCASTRGVREGDEVGAALRPAAREADRPRRGPRRVRRAAGGRARRDGRAGRDHQPRLPALGARATAGSEPARRAPTFVAEEWCAGAGAGAARGRRRRRSRGRRPLARSWRTTAPAPTPS